MKANKKLIICALLLITMISIVGAVNASDSTNGTLTTTDTTNDAVSIDDSQTLSESSTTDSSSNNDLTENSDSETQNTEKTTTPTKVGNKEDQLTVGSQKTVTNTTISEYFTEMGYLNENVTENDELLFTGDFKDNTFIIDKTVSLTGKNAIMTNTAIVIAANNVKISNFTFITNNEFEYGSIITSTFTNTTIKNNNITYNAATENSYAVYLEDAEGTKIIENIINYIGNSISIYANSINNLEIVNNTINYVGNTNGTVINNAIRIEGDDTNEIPSTNISVQNNKFDIAIPSVDVEYDWTTYEPTVYSEGIVFYYCEYLKFVNNTVNVKYNDFTTASGYDSIYAVSVKSNPFKYDFDDEGNLIYPIQTQYALIANNTIDINGHSGVYGISIAADKFKVNGNNIHVTSETYLGHGIDVNALSFNGRVYDNKINIKAPASYGIYSDGKYFGPVDSITYNDNNISIKGYVAAGMELMEKAPSVINNTIIATGNYTYGIVASIIDEGSIIDNKLISVGSNNGTEFTGDPLLPLNSMGINVKGDCLIANNIIGSNNIGINLVEDGIINITNNLIYTKANALIDSYGIYSQGLSNLTITDNNLIFIGNTDGTVVNNGVHIEGDDDEDNPIPATNIIVQNNRFNIAIPSVDIGYDPETWASTVMNDAIVFYYCEGLEFVNNTVNVKYNNFTTAYGWDSLYAVSVRSDAYTFGQIQSKDVTIANNNITIDGHSCTYAVYVCADDFEVTGNNINSTSETYLAHGIDVDGPSANGIVSKNNISAKSPLATYGIYSYQYMGSIENITYYNNNIETTGYASAGMEIVECNPNIIDNTIIAAGNYTYGIITSIKDEGIIQGNEIKSTGTNKGTDLTGDSLLPLTSMGISVKGKVGIEGNTIETTGTAINVVDNSTATLINNNIISEYSAIKKLNEEIAENEKQIDNLTNQTEKLTNQTEKLTNEVSNLKEENEKLTTQKDDANKALAAKDKEATQLTVDKTNLQNQVNSLNSQLKTANSKADDASANLKKVSAKTKVKKSKNFKITATLNKKVKGKYVYVVFNGKSYKAKTDKNGVAKITIKKSALKKLAGKKVKYQVMSGQKLINKSVKIKK